MSGILNTGTRALQANQTALQTAGNNIANVNTKGYSRQSVVLATVEGQFTGGGYVGKGVEVQTIQRNFSAFLTRQSALAGSTQAADNARVDKLSQLESIFSGGSTGLGASINEMLNSFSDVASAPTDLTARTVALTRIDETAARMRSSSQRLDDLQQGVTQELDQKVTAINSLAQNIAEVNGQIARVKGNGQTPNDLLDKRDQLVRELNTYVQTSSIPADDGTLGIFIGGSQALVLGTTAAPVSIVKDDFGDTLTSKLAITRNGQSVTLDEKNLGGGEVSGLLRFQNSDLVEGRNLLGRLTLAVGTAMNDQHKLGLDLDGVQGDNLFSLTDIKNNVLQAKSNSVGSTLTLGIDPNNGLTKFAASDYEVSFSATSSGVVTRLSDKNQTPFSVGAGGQYFFYNPVTNANDLPSLDGLTMLSAATPPIGDRFLLKPFSTAASNISSAFSSPRALAIASPITGGMGTTNTGSLQLSSLQARSNTSPLADVPLTFKFISPNKYIRSDDPNYAKYPAIATPPQPQGYDYTPGKAIESALITTSPATGWSVTLQGSPKAGDTFTVGPQPAANRNLNAGNASAMLGLRDVTMFDGGVLTDGYAGLISQIGIRTQSATYAATVSNAIATDLEKERTSVSGVNLDEEAAQLLQYQQAYQASAKLIQVAQSVFDTLIQTMGR